MLCDSKLLKKTKQNSRFVFFVLFHFSRPTLDLINILVFKILTNKELKFFSKHNTYK